jgi:hypothetical protein
MRGRCRSALLAAVAWIALGCAPSHELPPPLHGRWTCDDPRYYGRALVLTGNSVTFETGVSAPEVHVVRSTSHARDRKEGVRYVIGYGGDGEVVRELRLHLVYSAPLSVRIGERPERWLKTGRR